MTFNHSSHQNTFIFFLFIIAASKCTELSKINTSSVYVMSIEASQQICFDTQRNASLLVLLKDKDTNTQYSLLTTESQTCLSTYVETKSTNTIPHQSIQVDANKINTTEENEEKINENTNMREEEEQIILKATHEAKNTHTFEGDEKEVNSNNNTETNRNMLYNIFYGTIEDVLKIFKSPKEIFFLTTSSEEAALAYKIKEENYIISANEHHNPIAVLSDSGSSHQLITFTKNVNTREDIELFETIVNTVAKDEINNTNTTISTSTTDSTEIQIPPPVIDLNGPDRDGLNYETVFIEGEGHVAISSSSATISGSQPFSQCSFSITSVDTIDESEKLSINHSSLSENLHSSWDQTEKTLTIEGPGSIDDFLSALSAISYSNPSDSPSLLPRRIEITCFIDGYHSNQEEPITATSIITTIPINSAPIITIDPKEKLSKKYSEGQSGLLRLFENQVKIHDDGSSIDHFIITIDHFYDHEYEDILIDNEFASEKNHFSIEKYYDLHYQFIIHSKTNNFQDLFKRLYYENKSPNPSPLNRQIHIQCVDTEGLLSNPIKVTVSVTPVNDAPVLSYHGNYPPIKEKAETFLFAGLKVSDIDSTLLARCSFTFSSELNLQTEQFTLRTRDRSFLLRQEDKSFPAFILKPSQGHASISAFQQHFSMLSFSTSFSDGELDISVVCYDDQHAPSNEITYPIHILAVNDPPRIDLINTNRLIHRTSSGSTIFSVTYEEGTELQAFPTPLISDEDDGDHLERCTIELVNKQHAESIYMKSTVSGIDTLSFNTKNGQIIQLSYADKGHQSKTEKNFHNFREAFKNIYYSNRNQNPNPSSKSIITAICQDAGDENSESNYIKLEIDILPINDPPTISSSSPDKVLFKNELAIFSKISINDPDSPVASCSARIIPIQGNDKYLHKFKLNLPNKSHNSLSIDQIDDHSIEVCGREPSGVFTNIIKQITVQSDSSFLPEYQFQVELSCMDVDEESSSTYTITVNTPTCMDCPNFIHDTNYQPLFRQGLDQRIPVFQSVQVLDIDDFYDAQHHYYCSVDLQEHMESEYIYLDLPESRLSPSLHFTNANHHIMINSTTLSDLQHALEFLYYLNTNLSTISYDRWIHIDCNGNENIVQQVVHVDAPIKIINTTVSDCNLLHDSTCLHSYEFNQKTEISECIITSTTNNISFLSIAYDKIKSRIEEYKPSMFKLVLSGVASSDEYQDVIQNLEFKPNSIFTPSEIGVEIHCSPVEESEKFISSLHTIPVHTFPFFYALPIIFCKIGRSLFHKFFSSDLSQATFNVHRYLGIVMDCLFLLGCDKSKFPLHLIGFFLVLIFLFCVPPA